MNRHEAIGYSQAVGAAIFYGLSSVANRHGLLQWGSPFVAATWSLLGGLLALALLTRLTRSNVPAKPLSVRPVVWMFLAGIAAGVGVVSHALALHVAPVAVVAPIGASYVLLTILLAHLFLREDERVTPRLTFGGLLVVAGVIVVALGK